MRKEIKLKGTDKKRISQYAITENAMESALKVIAIEMEISGRKLWEELRILYPKMDESKIRASYDYIKGIITYEED